jgi:hypothetical protein
VDWEKPLESSKGKKREKSSRFNARRRTVQMHGISMGHATDACQAMPHDASEKEIIMVTVKVQAMGRYAAVLRPVAAWL